MARRLSKSLILSLLLSSAICACGSAPKSASRFLADSSAVDKVEATLSSTQTINGGVVLAHVKLPATVNATSVTALLGDTEIPFYASDYPGVLDAVIGVPFQQAPGKVPVIVRWREDEEDKQIELKLDVTEGDYVSETLKVATKHVKPRKKDLARIKREMQEVGSIYKMVTPERFWSGPFILPINSPMTSRFGNKRLFNGQMQSFHQGLDLKAQIGTTVKAAAGGVVVLAKDLFFSGRTVLIDHGYGIYTLYAHLNKISVKKGQKLKIGQRIGKSGKTGRVSGPHLHWGAVVNRAKVDPTYLTKIFTKPEAEPMEPTRALTTVENE